MKWASNALATMESRARGADRCSTALEGPVCYRRTPAPVRPVSHRCLLLAAPERERILGVGEANLEGSPITEDAPGDAGELIGKGNGGEVVAATVFDLEGPGAEIVGLL